MKSLTYFNIFFCNFAQVNIEEEHIHRYHVYLYEQKFLKPEDVWEPRGEVTKSNYIN